jgi:hypothetical protein
LPAACQAKVGVVLGPPCHPLEVPGCSGNAIPAGAGEAVRMCLQPCASGARR